jgi:multidrug resistance efflux pump
MMEEHDGPFLENAPPLWVARGSATLLLLLVASALVAAAFVHVPETVLATFVLTWVRGGDPIRAFRSGIVTEVYVTEAKAVRAGEAMFTIASSSVGDRSAESNSLESQIVGGEERLASRRERVASQRRADDEESRKLQGRLESLARTADIRRKQLGLAVARARTIAEAVELGLSSRIEMSRAQSEADTFALGIGTAGPPWPQYAVHPDGKRFLMSTVTDEVNSPPITVIFNFKPQPR